MKNNAKITIRVLIIFIGICILSSTYFDTKKHEVFDEMNRLYYEEIVKLDDIVEVTDRPILLEQDTPIEEVPEEVISNEEKNDKPNIDYTSYYIGSLKIPKINLERGFLDKESRYNNVNYNIYVHPSSDYPDVDKGNLILASHSGTSSISYFKNLYQITLNDDIYINYKSKEYHYKVVKIYKDDKDGNVAIRRDYDKTTLTLITCTKNDKTTQTIYICELI